MLHITTFNAWVKMIGSTGLKITAITRKPLLTHCPFPRKNNIIDSPKTAYPTRSI